MSPPSSPRKEESPQGAVRRQHKEVSPAAFKAAFEIAKILSDLSKKDQKSAMQMSGVQVGLSVTTQFAQFAAPAAAAASAAIPKGSRGGKIPPPTSKWGADVRSKQSEIASLNKAIAEESAKVGQQLPESHALIERRAKAFRDLKGLKSQSGASQ